LETTVTPTVPQCGNVRNDMVGEPPRSRGDGILAAAGAAATGVIHYTTSVKPLKIK